MGKEVSKQQALSRVLYYVVELELPLDGIITYAVDQLLQ